jgi:nucleotide-binding universal stress UspA family protein
MTDCPRSIVVAVDFGEASGRAVGLAGDIAARSGATLRLLHAEQFEAPAYFTLEQLAVLHADDVQSRRRAREAATAFGREHTAHPFTVVVATEPPVEAILHAATSADLLVMGTHGRRGASRWWLGSVAERVLRHVTTPLLIVHAATSAAVALDTLLVHNPAQVAGARTLQYATALARCVGASVRRDMARDALAQVPGGLVVVPAPMPPGAEWLSLAGEALVRGCSLPLLFVPEALEGDPV